MMFVNRDQGAIIAVFARRQHEGQESISDTDPDYISFLNPPPLTHSEIYDQIMQNSQLLRAVVKAINGGTLVTGANKTGPELKATIEAQMNGI